MLARERVDRPERRDEERGQRREVDQHEPAERQREQQAALTAGRRHEDCPQAPQAARAGLRRLRARGDGAVAQPFISCHFCCQSL